MNCSVTRRSGWSNFGVRLLVCFSLTLFGGCNLFPSSEDEPPRMIGAIYSTDDGGDNLARTWIEATDMLHDIANAGFNIWVVVGNAGVIYRTTDGGSHWLPATSTTVMQLRSVTNNRALQVLFASGQEGTLLRSIDAGVTWNSLTSGTTHDLASITAYTNVVLAVGGNGTIIRSTDGGGGWSLVNSSAGYSLRDVAISEENDVAYAVGTGGTILHSSDGGATWSQKSVPVVSANDVLTSVVIPDPISVFISGYHTNPSTGAATGIIIRTIDGGATWTVHETAAVEFTGDDFEFKALYGLSHFSGQIIAVGAERSAYITNDDGENWVIRSHGVTPNDNLNNADLYGLDVAFIVGNGQRN